jgi:hypothetical protein
VAAIVLGALFAAPASAHGIFKDLLSEAGTSCCSGADDETGDCERLTADQVIFKQTTVIIRSKRYKASVVVPMHRTQWKVPEHLEPGYVGVWCGQPRVPDKPGLPLAGLTQRQPDPRTVTYCLFLEPGGV